jgi:hypothetical protein
MIISHSMAAEGCRKTCLKKKMGQETIFQFGSVATDYAPYFRGFARTISIEWRVRVWPERDCGPNSIARPVINPL